VENYAAHPVSFKAPYFFKIDSSFSKEYLDNFNFHVIPCANPDGYEFSRKSEVIDYLINETIMNSLPFQRTRLWRKNRSLIPAQLNQFDEFCRGVDLNRNFDNHWNGNH